MPFSQTKTVTATAKDGSGQYTFNFMLLDGNKLPAFMVPNKEVLTINPAAAEFNEDKVYNLKVAARDGYVDLPSVTFSVTVQSVTYINPIKDQKRYFGDADS